MSALPVEQQPSGTTPADTGRGSRGPRPRLAGAPARRDVHPLFPSKRAVLPDGDCVFPGGGERFSGASQSCARRPSRPAGAGSGLARPVASSRRSPVRRLPRGPEPDGSPGQRRPSGWVARCGSPGAGSPGAGSPGPRSPGSGGATGLGGPGGRGRPLPADPAHQARPDRRGGAGRRGGLGAVRGRGRRGPGQRPGGPRSDRIRPADHRPAGQHTVVHRPERGPARRRADRCPGNAAGQSAQDRRHHGRAAPVGAARLAARARRDGRSHRHVCPWLPDARAGAAADRSAVHRMLARFRRHRPIAPGDSRSPGG